MKLERLDETTEILDRKIEKIPAYKTCINSKVPEGRVWCNHYNQTLAGRCNKACIGYKDKFLEKVA